MTKLVSSPECHKTLVTEVTKDLVIQLSLTFSYIVTDLKKLDFKNVQCLEEIVPLRECSYIETVHLELSDAKTFSQQPITMCLLVFLVSTRLFANKKV